MFMDDQEDEEDIDDGEDEEDDGDDAEEEEEEQQEEEKDDDGGEKDGEPCLEVDTSSTDKLGMLQFAKPMDDLHVSRMGANDILAFFKSPQSHNLPWTMDTIERRLCIRLKDAKRMIKTAKIDVPSEAQDVVHGASQLTVVYRSPVQLALRAILRSTWAKDPANLLLDPAPADPEGDGLLGHLNTGEFWAKELEAQKLKFQDADAKEGAITTLAPLYLHSDKCNLDEKGRNNAHPLSMAVGNFSNDIQRRPASRELVALLPILGHSTAQNDAAKGKLTAAQRLLTHSAVGIVLADIAKDSKDGIIVTINGVKRRLIFFVVGLCADAEEACTIALVKRGGTARPCFLCTCKKAKIRDETFNPANYLRAQEGIYQAYKTLNDDKASEDDKDLATEYLDKRSIVSDVTVCGYEHDCFGITRDGGKFSALQVDLLHQYDLGIMKYAVKWTLDLIKKHKKRGALGEVDRLISALRSSHNSDRDSFSIASFPNGITNRSRVMGQELSGMVLSLLAIVASDVDNQLLSWASRLQVIKALDRVYRLRQWLTQEELQLAPIKDGTFDKAVREVMELLKEAFAGCSPSDFKFIKFHLLLHYKDMILQYGSIMPFSTHSWEAALKFLVKGPFRFSNRQSDGDVLDMQLLTASIKSAELGIALAQYEDPDVQTKMKALFERVITETGPYPSFYKCTGRAGFFTPRPVSNCRPPRRRSRASTQTPYLVPLRDGEEVGADIPLWYMLGGERDTAAVLPVEERDAVRFAYVVNEHTPRHQMPHILPPCFSFLPPPRTPSHRS